MSGRQTTFLFIVAVLSMGIGAGCSSSSRIPASTCHQREGLDPALLAVIEQHRSAVPALMKKGGIPGCVIALADERGLLWTEGFGYADRKRRVPATSNTPFLLCSISKTITATAIMLAVQDGLLDLDAPIVQYLPDFSVRSRYEEHAERKITLRRLLTHTAGLPLDSSVGNIFQVTDSFDEHVRSAYGIWLIYPVGEAFSYSNIGIDLAAYALQETAAMTFAQYVKERLFLRLGMSNSLIDSRDIVKSSNRAVGHATPFARMPFVISALGAGGMYASAEDLSRFIQLHLNRGRWGSNQLLDKSLVEVMYTPGAVAEPNVHRGLGFAIVNRDGNREWCLLHAGSGYGFETVLKIYPEYGIGEVILTNQMPNEAMAELSIAHKLIQTGAVTRHLGMPTIDGTNCVKAWDRKPACAGSAYKREWKRYCGTYDLQFIGYEFQWWAAWGMAVLHPDGYVPFIRVYEDGECLRVTESHFFEKLRSLWNREEAQALEEIGPGLFSTTSGAVLDMSGTTPLWRNYRLVRR